jgi:hypothetical protein
VNIYDELNAQVSGGTTDSMPYMMRDRCETTKGYLQPGRLIANESFFLYYISVQPGKEDTLLKTHSSQPLSSSQLKFVSPPALSYDATAGKWVGSFQLMSKVMALAVSRSNAVLKYSTTTLKYR